MNKNIHKFGDVIIAARKEIGLTQYQLCKQMGLSQSNLSKIESNQLKPPADIWIEFCERFELPVDSYRSGYIDSFDKKILTELGVKRDIVDIPEKYIESAFLRVRFLVPIFEHFKVLHGTEKFNEVLSLMEVDTHYLSVRDNLLNFRFVSELIILFNERVDKIDFAKIATFSKHDFVHGKTWIKINHRDIHRSIKQVVKQIDYYIKNYYLRHDLYINSQVKLTIPPFPSRPSFLKDISLIEKINFIYLPNFIKNLFEESAQVEFLDEGPSFQIFVKAK